MADQDDNDRFHDGLAAFNRGTRREDCPYPYDSYECETWLKGWDHGHSLDEDVDLRARPGT